MTKKQGRLAIPYSIAKALLSHHLTEKGVNVNDKDFDKEYGPAIMKLYGTDEPPVNMDHLVRPDLNDEQFAEHIRDERAKAMWEGIRKAQEDAPHGVAYLAYLDDNGRPTCQSKRCGECAACYDRDLTFSPVVIAGAVPDFMMDPAERMRRLENLTSLSIGYLSAADFKERRLLGLPGLKDYPSLVDPVITGGGKTDLLRDITMYASRFPGIRPPDLSSRVLSSEHITNKKSGGFRRGEFTTFSSMGRTHYFRPVTSHLANLVRSMAGLKDVWHVSLEDTPRGFFAYDYEANMMADEPEGLDGVHHTIRNFYRAARNGVIKSFSPKFDMKELLSKPVITTSYYGDIEVGGKKVPGVKSFPETLRFGYHEQYFADSITDRTLYRKHYFARNGVSGIDGLDADYYGNSMLLRPVGPRDSLGYPVREDWAEEAIDKMIWLQLNKDHQPLSFHPTYGHVRSITNIGKPRANWQTLHIKEAARERLRQAISPGKDKRGY